MKHFLFFAFLAFLPTFSYSQLNSFLKEENHSFTKWERIDEAKKSEILNSFLEEGYLKDYAIQQDYKNNFFVIDFDADGEKDVIYYGYTGAESQYIFFFRKNSDSYKQTFAVAGKLVYLSDYEPFSPLSFAIEHYGCCSDIVNNFEYYVPVTRNKEPSFQLAQKIGSIDGTSMPESYFPEPLAFKTTNETYSLRLEPLINNDKGFFDGEDIEGNIVAKFPSGSEGYALAEQPDETGRVWWLVIMKNNLPSTNSLFHKGWNNEEEGFSMGWMSSRYLEAL